MTSMPKVTDCLGAAELNYARFLEELDSFNSCNPSVRHQYQFEKKIFLIQQFQSMRNHVDKCFQTITDKRLRDTEKHLYENYFKCILRSPTPKFNMNHIYAEQQRIIDKINTFEIMRTTYTTECNQTELNVLECWEVIQDNLKHFSKHFYVLGFEEIDMDVKTLRAFSQHMRFYPEVLDQAI